MIKIYFTAATSFNGELTNSYKQIISIIKNKPVILLSGKQIVDESLFQEDKKLSKKDIFRRERRLIDEADLVISYITKPSLGVGSEITYALSLNKPILALAQIGQESKISPIIAGNPSENLFIKYYNQDNLHLKIDEFIKHIQSITKRKGKLIVIEGTDGSGKTTQSQLLVSYFKEKKIPVKYFDFPQYYHSFHGKTVAKFLRGEFGDIKQISPYLASLAYALDRASVKKEMEEFLNKGGLIVANRYVSSNMAHQGAKFKEEKERDEFLKWVYELEYKVHKMPKEDLVIYLYVPWQIGMKLTKKKEPRKYLEGTNKDIQENSTEHRISAENMYFYLSQNNNNWVKVNCVENNRLLNVDQIHNKITKIISPYMKIFDK